MMISGEVIDVVMSEEFREAFREMLLRRVRRDYEHLETAARNLSRGMPTSSASYEKIKEVGMDSYALLGQYQEALGDFSATVARVDRLLANLPSRESL